MPRGLRSILRAWLGLIVGGTLLGAIIALGLALVTPPTYTASVTLLVTPVPRDTGITNGDLQVARELTSTIAELATTRPVLDRVILSTKVAIDAELLALSVTTRVPSGTSLLDISVQGLDPSAASAIANAIASELRAYALPEAGSPNAGLQVDATVVDPATPPTIRDGPGPLVRTALGGAIALFLTISIAFLVENVWPRGRETAAAPPMAPPISTPTVPPDTGRTFADRQWAPIRGDVLESEQSTIGVDPLQSTSAAAGARIASRGIVNDLEVETTRRSD